MNNFSFQNPTRLVFGKGQIAKLATLIPAEAKVMVTYGGGSVRRNGVYDQVVAALEGRNYVEFWGIEPNPRVETLRRAVELGKAEGVNYLLAVGGGSVIDGTKLISAAIASDEDAWALVLKGADRGGIPLAAVLTIPATGSEMNSGAVISREETHEKYAFYGRYPEFSILDPEVTYSLPDYQIACGLSDIFVHVMEQYLTTPDQSRVMDRWAEGLLQTVIEIAPLIRANKTDYRTMADFMFSATMALNGYIAQGVTEDWATHMIGHELTALAGITHGASLAIVLPATMSVLRDQKGDKILQYGARVWGIDGGTTEERIEATIARTREFFKSLGLAVSLTEAGISLDVIDTIAERFTASGVHHGEAANVDGEMARRILEACK
ncbi:MAG: iron-containing alcohol dehydrogenase [Rikenellaceae bacterium]|nr:iron-containing alcohol dehydrogenase [Rikenellaceae bacterium]MBR2443518.1 iron-containing alcohol dehydrogenase [Rikenellaceae bacterium]